MEVLLIRHGKMAGDPCAESEPPRGGCLNEECALDLKLAVFAHGGSLGALLGFLCAIPPFPVSRFNFDLTGLARTRMHGQHDIWYPQLVVAAP